MTVTIAKEEIPSLKIVPAFVDQTAHWNRELDYAVRLGNEMKGKTTITFETTRGPQTVETTIWSHTEDCLMLKGGLTLPLNSIITIHF